MTAWHEQPNAALAFCVALEALRSADTSVTVMPDNEEAETLDRQCGVDVVGPWTGAGTGEWKIVRYYGQTPLDAVLAAAADQARAR